MCFIEQKDKGVNIIAVGIGKRIKKSELQKIAGERGSVVQVPDFDALAGKINEILAEVCGKRFKLFDSLNDD